MKGTVVKSTGSWYAVLDEEQVMRDCRLRGNFRIKGIKSTNPVAVGDRVDFELEEGEQTGVINEIEERKNYIVRKATRLSKQTHIIAANVDQAVLVVTLAQPRTSLGFINRFLVTAEAYQIPVIIAFNKIDIYDDKLKAQLQELKDTFEPLGYTCVEVSAEQEMNVEELKGLLKDKINLFSGQSGVGKSSLINVLEPSLDLKVDALGTKFEKGQHTTTFAEMLTFSFGGFLIDTPGIREFGLVDIAANELSHYFPEMKKVLSDCKFNNCLHVDEPDCAVKAALERGEIKEGRYKSYLTMLKGEEE